MSELPLLSQEQIKFLAWLADQPEPLSMLQLSEMDAPGYTRERLVGLEDNDHLIDRLLDSENGFPTGKYCVNDKGRAVLLKIEQERSQAAEEKERYEHEAIRADAQNRLAASQNKILVAQTVVALVSFVAGLLAEYFGCVLERLFDFFR